MEKRPLKEGFPMKAFEIRSPGDYGVTEAPEPVIGEIVQVEHLSGIVLGPNDLSGSLGLLTQTSHPDVQRCFDLVAKAAHRANLPFGVSTGYGAGQAGAAMRQWLDRGANFVFAGSDIAYSASGAAQTFADMAGIFG